MSEYCDCWGNLVFINGRCQECGNPPKMLNLEFNPDLHSAKLEIQNLESENARLKGKLAKSQERWDAMKDLLKHGYIDCIYKDSPTHKKVCAVILEHMKSSEAQE